MKNRNEISKTCGTLKSERKWHLYVKYIVNRHIQQGFFLNYMHRYHASTGYRGVYQSTIHLMSFIQWKSRATVRKLFDAQKTRLEDSQLLFCCCFCCQFPPLWGTAAGFLRLKYCLIDRLPSAGFPVAAHTQALRKQGPWCAFYQYRSNFIPHALPLHQRSRSPDQQPGSEEVI